MNILNLPNLCVHNIKENDLDYCIAVEYVSPPYFCPQCGSYKPHLTRFGKKKQLFMDLPIHGKRVGVQVDRQRYRCNECQSTFFEPLEDMDEKRSMTKRLIQYIEKQSLKRTFVSISEDIGLDEKTIRNIFRDYVNRLEETIRFETPKWLGIDEVHIIKPRCVISNIEHRTVVDILPNRNKDTVINYLSRLPNKNGIHYVTMDMWEPYRDAARTVLTWAKVIVDKFHVVRMANQALDTFRKELREDLTRSQRRTLMHDRFTLLKRRSELNASEILKLQSWTLNFPTLGIAYNLKESFFDIWDSSSKLQAKTRYQEWLQSLPADLEPTFKPLITAMTNWETEIFNYFDHPITNAYTEALNGLIRVMNRMGRGYSFEALRAKILFTEGVHKVKKPKYQKQGFMMDTISHSLGRMISETESFYQMQEKNFGADISTLIKKIEQEEI